MFIIYVDETQITLTNVHDTRKRNIEYKYLIQKSNLLFGLVTIFHKKSHIAPVLKYIF